MRTQIQQRNCEIFPRQIPLTVRASFCPRLGTWTDSITQPLTVFIPEKGKLAAHKMPAGALIEVQINPFNDGRFVSAKWGQVS